jgi:hypothetical protein
LKYLEENGKKTVDEIKITFKSLLQIRESKSVVDFREEKEKRKRADEKEMEKENVNENVNENENENENEKEKASKKRRIERKEDKEEKEENYDTESQLDEEEEKEYYENYEENEMIEEEMKKNENSDEDSEEEASILTIEFNDDFYNNKKCGEYDSSLVNARIQVYWPEERRWRRGKVLVNTRLTMTVKMTQTQFSRT